MPTDFAPHNMTGNAAPAPFVASASTTFSPGTGFDPWNAFDGLVSGTPAGWTGTHAGVDWLQIQIAAGNILASYSIAVKAGTRGPKNWTMLGSNDGLAWTTLDTQIGAVAWANGETRTFTVATIAGPFTYFRLNITVGGDGTYTNIGELYLFSGLGSTAQTVTFPAITGPTLTASASSGLPISYSIVSGPGTVSGNTLSIAGAGAITVQASQFGSATYAAATPVTKVWTLVDFAPHTMTSVGFPGALGDASLPPYVASASTEGAFGSDYAWRAFDGGNTTAWLGNTGGGVDWLRLDLGPGNAAVLYGYTVWAGYTSATSAGVVPPRAPKDWVLEGSSDGAVWTPLDTETAQTVWVPAVDVHQKSLTFTIAAPGTTAYRYFRFRCTANNGDATYVEIDELYLFGQTVTILSPQTITFPAIPSHFTGDPSFPLGATASSGLAVSYVVTSGPATIAGSTLTITGAGTVTIQATQAGNGTYAAATPVSQSFIVTHAQRGNISYDQIKTTDRTGNGHQLLTWSTAPLTSGAVGKAGQIAYDAAGNYYWCYANNLWARIGPGGYSLVF
ncbi:MAG: discoidin domain-containing protein [Ignavibacteriota bacterium]